MRNNTLLKITVGIVVAFGIALAVTYVGYGELDRLSEREANFEGRSVENGAKLFETNCIGCHGVQGQGIPGVAPSLNSEAFFTTRLEEVGYAGSLESYIELTVAAGRPVGSGQYAAVMPTWGEEYGGPLRPDQVRDLSRLHPELGSDGGTGEGGEAAPTEEVVIDPNADPVEIGKAVYNSTVTAAPAAMANQAARALSARTWAAWRHRRRRRGGRTFRRRVHPPVDRRSQRVHRARVPDRHRAHPI